ncbi:MAG: EamA family transporter [Planctomycetota bacterium]|nr:EamA family transporter [Planctomycetota bacterium]
MTPESDGTVEGAGPRPRVANLLVAVLCLTWGSTWFVIAIGLRDLPPFTSAGVRFFCAALVMGIVAAALRRREGGAAPPWWLALVMGVSQFSVSYGIVYWAEDGRLPSGLVSVLWGTYPLMIAVAGHWFLEGERMRLLQALGLIVGFGGVALMYATDLHAMGQDKLFAASVLLLSPLTVCAGTVVIKRHGASYSSVLMNRDGMAVGALLLLAAAWITERDAEANWTPAAVASVAYLTLVGSVLSFGIFFWLLRYDSATRLSIVAYVTPVVALALGAAVLDEEFGALTLTGAGLILLGVWLAGRRNDR